MIKRLSILLILSFTVNLSLVMASAIALTPYPQEIVILESFYKLRSTVSIDAKALGNDTLIFSQLKQEFAQKQIILITSNSTSADITFNINRNKAANQESYRLFIHSNKIEISAPSIVGIFYGVQTLKQIIRTSEKQQLPCLEISDSPDFIYRAVLDDISRGPVPQLSYIKEQIRRFSELKMNVLSYYTEHTIETNVHPEYAPANGGIPLKVWDEVVDYAAQHHMTVMPMMQSLGHCEEILAHPKFSHLGQGNTMLALNNLETMQFLDESFSDVAPHFSSPYFSVCGDEAWDLGRGASKALGDSIGLAALYANHMIAVHSIVSKAGKTMMLASDMATKYPEVFALLPKDIVMQAWDYTDTDDFSHWIAPIKEHGFSYVALTGVLNSSKTIPDYKICLNNIRKFSAYALKEGAIGTKVTVWDDDGRHSFNRDWYGVAFAAEHAWHSNNYPISDFDQRFNLAIYNDEKQTRTQIIHQLNKLSELPETSEMNNRILWEKLIPQRGQRTTIELNNWVEVLHIAEEAKRLYQKAKGTIYYDYELPYLNFTADQYYYMAKSRLLLLEAADAYRQACIIQYNDSHNCNQLLAKAKSAVNESVALWEKLSTDMLSLWKNESQDYWLNYAMDPYNRIIYDYQDLQSSLEWAMSLFAEGKNLPTPLDIRLEINTTTPITD